LWDHAGAAVIVPAGGKQRYFTPDLVTVLPQAGPKTMTKSGVGRGPGYAGPKRRRAG